LSRNTNRQNLVLLFGTTPLQKPTFFKTVHRTHFRFARTDKSVEQVDGHNQGKPDNFPHFCSRAKTTVFQAHTSGLHRFCSNRLVRRTKPSNKNAVCGALKGTTVINGISDVKSLKCGNYLSRCEGSLDHETAKIRRRLGGSRDLAAPNGTQNGIGNPLSSMIADSDHLTLKFALTRRAAQPPARRSPTESPKNSSSADDTFFAIPPRLVVARHEMTGPYFPLR
jgi:hypothetical protein